MANWTQIYFSLIVLFTLKLFTHSATEKIICKNTSNCSCASISSKFDFQCPLTDDPKIVISVRPESDVVVQCSTMNSWDLDFLPSMHVGEIRYLAFTMCPWPTDGFEGIMNRFGIIKTESLKFEYFELPKNFTLSADYFHKFKNLRRIRLSRNNIESVDVDMFKDMRELIEIDFQVNKLQIQKDLFKYSSNLEALDLSQNELSTLPAGIFSNLHKLKILHLWKNTFTTLNSGLFENLTSLRSLDLSVNHISNLPEDIFYPLKNLKELSLLNNLFINLPSRLFAENKLLEVLRFTRNEKLETLPENLFLNLSKLSKVLLNECKLKNLPNTLFEGTPELTELDLSNNELDKLPDNIFSPLHNLRILRLTHNNISSLPENIFSSLRKLEKLHLNKNQLTNISNDLFYRLIDLTELNMEHNQISVIEYRAFQRTENLININLAHNQLTLAEGDPFINCVKLKSLDLGHNLISSFYQSWLLSKTQITKLDLSYNRLTSIETVDLLKVTATKLEVDLSYNNITVVQLRQFVRLAHSSLNLNTEYTQVYLTGNPIHCDCNIYHLAKYFDGTIDSEVKFVLDIQPPDMTCSSPPIYKGLEIGKIKAKNLVCVINASECPEDCTCAIRWVDKTRIVDCASRNLTKFPRLFSEEGIYKYNQTEVRLQDNFLTTGPHWELGYENVTRLYLSNNLISDIEWIPPNLQMLKLDGNNIKNLNYDILNGLNNSLTLSNLSLENNPWQCDCSIVNLSYFLREHKEIQGFDVRCNRTGTQLFKLEKTDLCDWNYKIFMISIIIVVTFMLIIAVIAALYLKYHRELKVWLYAKGWCLWWVTESEVDRDKLYDAFISYSHKDEDFVEQTILPGLEQGPQAYKLCLHVRNWIAGELIAKQITRSVEESRRTLVVLSPHFLESTWGKLEFHAAHSQGMNEGRSRVIVILYGDIDPNTMFDDELKAYLKTNTYIKWGDPWFWQKLRYAMPHQKNELHSQKVNNIKITLDDKIDLMNPPQTPNNGSTTPIALDPGLLKNHPLNFTPSDAIRITPPAECGLLISPLC